MRAPEYRSRRLGEGLVQVLYGRASLSVRHARTRSRFAGSTRSVCRLGTLGTLETLGHLDTWTCAEGPLLRASLGSTLRRPVLPIAVSLSVPVQRYRTHPLYGAGWGFSEFEVSITNA